jgi:hypothetical protein
MKGVQERPWGHSCCQETKRFWEEDEDVWCNEWDDEEDDFEDFHIFHFGRNW